MKTLAYLASNYFFKQSIDWFTDVGNLLSSVAPLALLRQVRRTRLVLYTYLHSPQERKLFSLGVTTSCSATKTTKKEADTEKTGWRRSYRVQQTPSSAKTFWGEGQASKYTLRLQFVSEQSRDGRGGFERHGKNRVMRKTRSPTHLKCGTEQSIEDYASLRTKRGE